MRCDEFSARFDELLDERREPLDEPNMAAHVAECADCRRTASSISAAVAALTTLQASACRLPPFEVSVGRILAAVKNEEAIESAAAARPAHESPAKVETRTATGGAGLSSVWRGSAFYALMATAAMLVLAAYPIWRWNGASPTNSGPQGGNVAVGPATPQAAGLVGRDTTAGNTDGRDPSGGGLAHDASNGGASNVITSNGIIPEGGEALPSIAELARDSRDSYVRLAEDARRSLDDVLAVASVFASDAPAEPTPPAKTDGWLNHVETGLEPIKQSTFGTLDVLRQVVPADTETRS